MPDADDATTTDDAAGRRPESAEAAARVRLISLRSTPLSVDELLASVADRAAGGLGLFVGIVRDHDGGREVASLSYSAHPTASRALWEVALRVAEEEDVIAVAAAHRVGELEVGDTAVVVAVSAAHRGEALTACRRLIDELKAEVPIWKHQWFSDGSSEWVGVDLAGSGPAAAPTLVP